jgi:hypothetical protein
VDQLSTFRHAVILPDPYDQAVSTAATGSAGPAVRRVVARGVALVVVVQAVLLLVLSPHYGPHRDELYFVSAAIPPLLAAGCVVLAERWRSRRLVAAGVVLVLSAAIAWPVFLPVLPVRTWADTFYADAGEDQRETVGWPAYTDQIRAVVDGLTPEQRRTAVVFTQNYGEASAAEWYDVGLPVYSGHDGWRNWGPPPTGASPVVVVGDIDADRFFTGCRVAVRLHNRVGIDGEEQGLPVRVCDGPIGSWRDQWPLLSHYDA